MANADELVIAYASAWNEPNEVQRRAYVEACWSEASTVTGPNVQVTGRAALLEEIAQFHRAMPGYSGVITGFDAHHSFVRFTISLRDASGGLVAEAIDIGEIGADGLLRSIITFWGPAAPVPATWPSVLRSDAHSAPR